MRRVIVLNLRPKVSFRDRLEGRALWAVSHAHFGRDKSPTVWSVVNEMALALSQLRQSRSIHAGSQRELRRLEFGLEQQLALGEREVYSNLDRNHYHRDRLRTRQLNIKTERQRLALSQAQEERGIHDRLIVLLSRQRQLAGFYDDRKARS